jgi:uroporphyrinogen-III decarboxylase
MVDTKEFLTRLWNLEDVDRPAYQINPIVREEESKLERFNDPHKMLQHQLREIETRRGITDDYVAALFPYLGTAIIPSAFGCEVRWFEDQDPWAMPLINTDPNAVYDLDKPLATDGLLGKVLDYTVYLANQSDGRFPIRMTDIQSPLDAAYLIWRSEDFLVAMFTNPAEVHHLLSMVTDLIIDFIMAQRELAPEFIPCHYPSIFMPDGLGIAISDDALAILSPSLYEEFGLPYVTRLAETFNGIFIHSCGDFSHNLANLAKVPNLRGLDFAAGETSFEMVADRFWGKAVLSIRLGLNKKIQFPSIPAFVEHVLKNKSGNRGIFLVIDTWYRLPSTGRPWREEDISRIYSLIHEYS